MSVKKLWSSMKKILVITVFMLVIFLSTSALGHGQSPTVVLVGGGDSRTVPDKYVERMGSFYSESSMDEIEQEDPADPQYGSISGSVHGSDGWSTFPLPFALVTAGGQSDLTNIFGNYVLHNLPLDVSLQVTASKSGWESQSYQVTLTASNPTQIVHFVLDEDDSGGGFDIWSERCCDRIFCSTSISNGDGVT
jgi:hypothetical protein